MEKLLSLKWKNHGAAFLHLLNIVRKQQMYTDVVLACSGNFYSAHRMVLTASSEYFRNIFEHLDCNNPVIVLKDIKCRDLEALLDYIYVGEANVRPADVASLIKAADCLQIKGLAVDDDQLAEDNDCSINSTSTRRSNRKRKLEKADSSPSNTKQAKYVQPEGSVFENNIYWPSTSAEQGQLSERDDSTPFNNSDELDQTYPLALAKAELTEEERIPQSDTLPSATSSQLQESGTEDDSFLLPGSPFQEDSEYEDDKAGLEGFHEMENKQQDNEQFTFAEMEIINIRTPTSERNYYIHDDHIYVCRAHRGKHIYLTCIAKTKRGPCYCPGMGHGNVINLDKENGILYLKNFSLTKHHNHQAETSKISDIRLRRNCILRSQAGGHPIREIFSEEKLRFPDSNITYKCLRRTMENYRPKREPKPEQYTGHSLFGDFGYQLDTEGTVKMENQP